MTLAILCSGQGAQRADMFDLTGAAPQAGALFAHAGRLLGDDPRAWVRQAGPDALRETVPRRFSARSRRSPPPRCSTRCGRAGAASPATASAKSRRGASRDDRAGRRARPRRRACARDGCRERRRRADGVRTRPDACPTRAVVRQPRRGDRDRESRRRVRGRGAAGRCRRGGRRCVARRRAARRARLRADRVAHAPARRGRAGVSRVARRD